MATTFSSQQQKFICSCGKFIESISCIIFPSQSSCFPPYCFPLPLYPFWVCCWPHVIPDPPATTTQSQASTTSHHNQPIKQLIYVISLPSAHAHSQRANFHVFVFVAVGDLKLSCACYLAPRGCSEGEGVLCELVVLLACLWCVWVP